MVSNIVHACVLQVHILFLLVHESLFELRLRKTQHYLKYNWLYLIIIICFGPQCILLGVRTIHVMLRYVIHLYDTRGAGTSAQRSWDKRGPLTYYTDLISELIVLAVDFFHHVHMLLWSNIFLSMASLVICMQLRYLFYEIQRRITKHRNYLAVLNHMEQKYV